MDFDDTPSFEQKNWEKKVNEFRDGLKFYYLRLKVFKKSI